MASTYAALSAVPVAQILLPGQLRLTDPTFTADNMQAQVTAAPSQAEFAAFADAMSTSYGAPIELVSVDPGSGQQTELADTSITNLLAELPVLETTANGVNLGLQLADGRQIQFASTAGLADFLYAAVGIGIGHMLSDDSRSSIPYSPRHRGARGWRR